MMVVYILEEMIFIAAIKLCLEKYVLKKIENKVAYFCLLIYV